MYVCEVVEPSTLTVTSWSPTEPLTEMDVLPPLVLQVSLQMKKILVGLLCSAFLTSCAPAVQSAPVQPQVDAEQAYISDR